MRIFLSYGHDEHAGFAERLKLDLEAHKHEVWFDLRRLKPGQDWERYIEDGLDWASATPGEGRFLLIMSPHSVRRPDGYCLNELARAWSRRLPIIPVMVAKVEPPLSICRIQSLDMSDCVPVEERYNRYQSKFARLLQAIEYNRLEVEGLQARLLNYLDPLPYEAEISQHLLRFTGRGWVARELEAWLAQPNKRIFWITGEAGVGKSALAAWLLRNRPDIVAFHGCRYGNSDRVNPRKVLASLAYQLSTSVSEYQERLNATDLDALKREISVRAVFERLFIEPCASMLAPEHPPIILIDGLDEATQNGKNELASIIGADFAKTPAWLRLIVTSRPHEQSVSFPLQAVDAWRLDAGQQENLDDIRKYLRHELRTFSSGDDPSAETIERLIAKSEGFFLYVAWVREELETGRLTLGAIDEFPQGLGGIYATFFQRYFPNSELYKAVHRPILEAICAAREPLEVHYLARVCDLDPDYAETELRGTFGSLFPIADGRIRPFHESLREWLTHTSRAGQYVASILKGHKRLAEYGWCQYRNGVAQMERYTLANLPAHLAACDRHAHLSALLIDFDWLQEKLKRTDILTLISDYDYASAATEAPLSLIHGALRLSIQALADDQSQLATQLLGRIPVDDQLHHRILDRSLSNSSSWFRPVTASLARERSMRWLRPRSQDVLYDMAFSSNSRWAAHVSGTFSETSRDVILWDLEEWRSLGPWFRTLPRLNPWAPLALSDDSQWCLYADGFGSLHRLGQAGEHWEGRAHEGLTIASLLAINVDGQRAVSADSSGRLVAWDLDAGQHYIIWDSNRNTARALRIDATGTKAVVAREDGTVHLLHLWPTREQILCKLPSPPTALAWSVDTQLVVIVGTDGRVEVRTTISPDPPVSVFSIDERPTSVALSGNTRYVAVGAASGTVDIWDVVLTCRTARYSRAHAREVTCIGFSRDDSRVMSADLLQIKEWAIRTTVRQESLLVNTRAAGQVKVTADGQHAVAVVENGGLGVWKLVTGKLESELAPADGPKFGDVGIGPAEGIAIAVDAPRLLAWNENLLTVWDLAAGAGLVSLRAAQVRDAVITPDGTGIVYISDFNVMFWKVERRDAEVVGTYERDRPRSVAISPDTEYALSSGEDRMLHLWRLGSLSVRQQLRERSRERTGAKEGEYRDFTPDASYHPDAHGKPRLIVFSGPDEAVIGSDDGELFMLDLRSEDSDPIQLANAHRDRVDCLLVVGEGRYLVSSSLDGTVQLWDLGKRQCISTLDTHPGIVKRVSISQNRMLLRGNDGILKMLSFPNGVLLAAFEADKRIQSCDADEDIASVVALDEGGQVHFLRFENSH